MFLREEMRRYNQVSSFDEQPGPELNSEAIDFPAASEFFKPIRRQRPAQNAQLRRARRMSHPANQFLLQPDFIQWQTRLKPLLAIVFNPSTMILTGADRAAQT